MGGNVALGGQAATVSPKVRHPIDKGMADNPLHVGLIGLDSMRRHHAWIIRAIEGMELVAVADPDGNHSGMVGGLSVLPDVHVLVDVGSDAAMVVAPAIYHEDITLTLAEIGMHTMVEKSTAHDTTIGHHVTATFAERGPVDAVGYVERCNPALQALRKYPDAGELDEAHQVLTRYQSPLPVHISDVGVVKDLATHDIDLIAWVADARYISVVVQVAYRSGRQNKDMMVATGLLGGGIVVGYRVNWLTPFKKRVTIVIGRKDALVANILTGDLTFHANSTVTSTWSQVVAFRDISEGDVIRYVIPEHELLVPEQENFRDAVRSVARCHVAMAEDMVTLGVVEAVLTPTNENRTVAL